jgi:hypothetical protein
MTKLNRYLSIFALVVVSGTPLLNKPVTATEAALTAPASYDYAYRYQFTRFEYVDGNSATIDQAYYTRTADGIYYNYSTGPYDINGDGLEVSMIFNRSNTTWSASPYRATDTKIGSDNSVGTIEKGRLIFDNQTNKNYLVYIDMSSNNTNAFTRIFYDDYRLNNGNDNTYTFYRTSLNRFFIPSFTKFEIRHYTNNTSYYLDAWYLEDIGISDAYNEGFDDGEVVGYEDGYDNSASPLWDGLEVAVGVTLNFILFIATLSIFDISLLNIGIVMVSILGLVWVLKALRG